MHLYVFFPFLGGRVGNLTGFIVLRASGVEYRPVSAVHRTALIVYSCCSLKEAPR